MTINKLKTLISLMEKIQTVSEEVREAVDVKRDWWYDKTEKWQDGETGQKWDDFLTEVESFLDDVDAISIPDFED